MPLEEMTMSQMFSHPVPHSTSLAALRQGNAPQDTVVCGFDTVAGFEAIQRMANLFSASSIVPDIYRSKGQNDYTSKGNCVIALDMALRMGANPLMVMQNLHIVHGRPAWTAQFLIATLNKSGKFSALRYAFQGTEGNDDWGCRACATELATGEKLQGPLITIGLAKKDGWYNKSGSKWQSMPGLMLRYRAAAWFVRTYAPEIAMGLKTVEEMQDTIDLSPQADGSFARRGFARQEEEKDAPSMTTADMAALSAPSTAEAVDVAPAAAEAVDVAPADGSETPPAAPAEEAATRKKTRKTDTAGVGGTAAPEAPAAAPSAPQDDPTIPCPRRDGGLVSTDDCFYCPERKGCPARDDADK